MKPPTTTCICGEPIPDSYLCYRCTRLLQHHIRTTPQWADQLDIVRLRLARYTPGNEGRRNRETPLPYHPGASQQAEDLDRLLRRCAKQFNAPTDILTQRLGIIAWWLADHIHDIRNHPDAQTWFTKIKNSLAAAAEIADRPPELWYAGKCPCGKDLYPTTTTEIVICPTCNHRWSTTDRRTQLLNQVRDVIAPGPDIARALSNLGDKPITPERLRKWRHNGKLQVQKFDPGPPPTNHYRVGDVIDLITKENQ